MNHTFEFFLDLSNRLKCRNVAPSIFNLIKKMHLENVEMSKKKDVPLEQLEQVYSDSPWQQRVDLELERQSLASKCQSFSSLISPWAIGSVTERTVPSQIHTFRSPLKSPVISASIAFYSC